MIIVAPQVNFLSLLPVPVREQIEHRLVGPFALVHIINILRQSGQVDDTKIAAAGGETVRRRLTDIVETRPDKLSADIRCMLYHIPRLFVCRTPGGVHIVVGRTHKAGIVIRLAPVFRGYDDLVRRHTIVTISL